MEASFKQELTARGLPAQVIQFLEDEEVISPSRLANFFDHRDDIKKTLENRLSGTPRLQVAKAVLTELWREADQFETLRLQRKSQGLEEIDSTDSPIPQHVLESLEAKFKAQYKFSLTARERLADTQLGRLKREIDKKSFAVFRVDKLKTAREAEKIVPTRQSKVTDEITIVTKSTGSTRDIPTVNVYLALLEILLIGGYVLIGSFTPAHLQPPACWASMEVCRTYLQYLRHKLCPLGEPRFSVAALRQADEDTRAMWAESMRSGMSLDEAFHVNEAKMHVLFLFTSKRDAQDAKKDQEEQIETPKGRKRARYSEEESPPRKARKVAFSQESSPKKAKCVLWNRGRCEERMCPNGRKHVCNFVDKKGNECNKQHRSCDYH